MKRRVCSLWLPRFALEQRRADTHRPRVLVAGTGGQERVAAVDARAAAAGLTPGQPLAEARAQAPELVSEAHAPAADARALRRLARWCGRYTPWPAPDAAHDAPGAAGVLLDITGCAHLAGGEAALRDDLLARVRGLGFTAHAAVAGTAGAAWALARFGGDDAAICPAGGEHAALAPLPPAALRLTGEQAALLYRLGLSRIDALTALPAAALAQRAGPGVPRQLDRALGRLGEPVAPLAPAEPMRAHRAFAEPIGLRGDLDAALAELAAALAARLDRAQRGARRLALTLARVDGTTQTVTVGTHRASREPAHLTRLLRERLDELDAGFGVEAMWLDAPAVEAFTARQGRFDGGEATSLTALIDRLTARLGAGAVARPAPRATHTPERAVAWADPLTPPAAAWPRVPPRPVRLWHPARALTVEPPDAPAHLHWGGTRRAVAARENLERLSPAWWRAPDAKPRDHLRLETAAGHRLWAVRQGTAWAVQGVFG